MTTTTPHEVAEAQAPTLERRRSAGGWLRRHSYAVVLATTDVLVLATATNLTPVEQRLGAAVTALILVAALGFDGMYRHRFTLSVLDDALRLIGLTVMAWAGAVFALTFTPGLATPHPLLLVTLATSLLAGRSVAYGLIRMARTRSATRRRVLIVGGGRVSASIGEYIEANPALGLEVVGYVESQPYLPEHSLPGQIVGDPEDLPDLIGQHDVDEVIIAYSAIPGHQLVGLLRSCDRAEAHVSVVPRLYELTPRRGWTDHISGMPLLQLSRSPFRTWQWRAKRAVDFVLALLALVILSPLLLMVALVLRITDGPGVLFRQVRVGLDGQEFSLLKFRSMRPATEGEGDTTWSIKGDDRISPMGRFLRRSSLDELPQLVNVLRGEMSLVGPRPERPHFVEVFSESDDRYAHRHRVPPGITGWAQIHGLRGDTSIAERARFDNFYIENWSLGLDMQILSRTLGSFLRGSG